MPLGRLHLKNLYAAAQLGCGIVPLMLSFYGGQKTVEDQFHHIVGKILMQYNMSYDRFRPWKGNARSATVGTITVFTHRDDCLAAKCAKGASACLHCQAAMTVGIHIDKAIQEELRILEENFWACSEELIDRLKQEREGWERENE